VSPSRSLASTATQSFWCRRIRCSDDLRSRDENADTLGRVRLSKQAGYLSSLAICNVPESSLLRESELVILTRAGPESASRHQAFTTQLNRL